MKYDKACCNKIVGNLIKDERQKQKITLAELSAGIMTGGNLCRIENGKRECDEATIKRLTDRLGMVYEEQGKYVFYDDYEEWQRRWQIIYAIESNNIGGARGFIDEYEQLYCSNIVRMQFAKLMKIQCRIEENKAVDRVEALTDKAICLLYKEALKLTVPVQAGISLKKLYLSVDELNIVLEYRFYNSEKNIGSLEEILEYLDNSRFSLAAKSMLYPKAVVYMYRLMVKNGIESGIIDGTNKEIGNKMYKYCEKALSILQEKAVRYYYTEILEIRKTLLVAGYGDGDRENMLIHTDEWLAAIYSLCNKHGVWEYTTNNCYFYKENSVYNIGTVVNIRRKMLRMTMKELYEGVCSEKTLRNLEHNRAGTHRDIAEELLGRLGLPAGYHRMGIITDKRETIELYTQWKRLSREFKFAECREIMNELEKQLSSNIVNRQFVEWGKNIVAYELKELDYITYIEKMSDCLGITIRIEDILSAKSIYLSNNEKGILYQISAKYKYNGDDSSAFKYIEPIYRNLKECTDIDIQENIKDYEFYMTFAASILGSLGKYEESNIISNKIIRAQLQYGRIGEIYYNLFNIAWNKNEVSHNKKAYTDSLYQCMLCSQMCNDVYFENRYRARMTYFLIG